MVLLVRKFPARIALHLVLLLLLAAPAAGQMSRYLVVYPSTITAGDYAGDVDLFSALFSDDATLGWPAEQPKSIATGRFREFQPSVELTADGGAWLAYTIEHTDTAFGGDQDILLRRIDRAGNNILGDSSASVAVIAQSQYVERNPRIVSSDAGVIAVYEVIDRADGSYDIAAVRLDGRGTPVWANPVWIASSRRRERLADVVSDTRGGAIAIIEATSGPDTAQVVDVIAVHVDAYGKVGWGASSEPAIVAGSRHIERNPVAVSDGFGGAFVAYEIEYTIGERAGDHDILAQHLTAQGAREWVSETALPFVSAVPNASEMRPVIALDTGGIVVAFEMDFHSEKKPVRIVGVQRLDLSGRLTWNRGKKPESILVPERIVERPQLMTDRIGGIFLIAEARDTISGDVDVYAQKFASGGEQLWANGELPVAVLSSDLRERSPAAQPDGMGGLVVVAAKDFITDDARTLRKIVAQHIGHDGRSLWTALGAPLLLSNTTTLDDKPVVIRTFGN